MNIRIPTELFGDINSYRFISLILDKNSNTIYRRDFVKTRDVDFFNKKLQYIVVPDQAFEECDSIIFFPFSEITNSWSNKISMWKNQEFIKMNGGYEFIKNADSVPDMDMIEQWLDTGRSIKISEQIIGTKNLIYFTLFGKDEYVELLKILLKSLRKQSYKNFEILFITDDETKKKITQLNDLKYFKCNYFIVEKVTDSVQASMQKLRIYEWEKINKYRNILFLDVDIIVVGDIKNILCGKGKQNIFYSAIHNSSQSLHRTPYHCLIDYSDEQLRMFEKKAITTINAGQFFFRNTNTMREHFENINSFVKIWNGRYFFEQSFLNYYFNLLEIADTKTFKEQFQFISINENQTNKKFGKNAVVVHFMGNACNGIGKLEFMKKYYGKYI
jgi:hypothetical protein